MRALPRPDLRLVVGALVTAALLLGGYVWLRDSSFVKVSRVDVTGLTGPQAGTIRTALENAGEEETTLHVDRRALERAVSGFAVVKGLRVQARFPHRLLVDVAERDPVAALQTTGADALPVAADGTLLRGTVSDGIPVVKLRAPVVGDRVTDGRLLTTIHLLATAPPALRAHVTTAFRGEQGLTVDLRDGPVVHFGSSARLAAKWESLVAVLDSPGARGASGIDVRVPERPAAAGLVAPPLPGDPSTTP